MTLTSTSMTGGAAETASAAGRGAMRPPDPGRDRGTFRDYLNDKVDTHLAGLTAAHAVDEANGDVLDALIDQSVAQQDAAVARELLQEATELRRREQTAASRAEAVASALAACEAEQAAHAGRFRALRQRLLGGPDSADADASADAPVNPSLQRTFIVQERRHWETAQRAPLRSAGLRDTSRLPAAVSRSGIRKEPPISTSSPRETTTSRSRARAESTSTMAAALLLTAIAASPPVRAQSRASTR